MYLILNKYSKHILEITSDISDRENDILDNNSGIAYSKSVSEFINVDNVPDEVAATKYTYKDGVYAPIKDKVQYVQIPENEYVSLRSDVDYLMLLNDPDSTSDTK